MTALLQTLYSRRQRIDSELQRCLRQRDVSDRLAAAMHYAVLNGGKRLRPLLAYAAAEALGGDYTCADVAGCAVELIHAYSLVHDDLPAMDDDVLRRGQPTCHVAFDEATAILAGDALQALAFELLAASPRLAVGHGQRLRMITELAQASGSRGMVGGQTLDIAATGMTLAEAELGRMHALKTGALITASVLLGALSTNLATEAQLAQLRHFAHCTGLAFQICDDILDVETSTAVSGKQQGKDAARAKPTYPAVLGLAGAKQRLLEMVAAADAALDGFGAGTARLRELARHMARRSF
jgi:geranylgeranyl diphosphate synthase, type II